MREFGAFDFDDRVFQSLVEEKLAEVGYAYTSDTAYDMLERQIETDLVPVLHEEYEFSLSDIYAFIQTYKK